MLKHVNLTTYYPQGNGQVESINKFVSRLLTELVNEKREIGMNICPQFCFHIRLLIKWQYVIYTLLISIWFTSSNANKICSIDYQWGPQKCSTNQSINCQNFRVGNVLREQIGNLEKSWRKLVEQIFLESTKKHKEEVSIWILCSLVSQGRKDTSRQIQKKMVWTI